MNQEEVSQIESHELTESDIKEILNILAEASGCWMEAD